MRNNFAARAALLLLLLLPCPAPAQGPANDPAQLLLSRARFHERLGETSEAIRFYEQAIPMLEAGSEHALAMRMRLAGLHASAGRHAEAMKIFAECRADKRFRDLLPERKAWHETLVKTGEAEAEIRFLRERIAEAIPGDRSDFELVDLLGVAGRRTEAVELMRSIASARPQDPFLKVRFAEMLQQNGQDAEALEALREAARMLPDDPQTVRKLGVALVSAGRRDEARDRLRALLRDPGNPQEYTALAEQYQALSMPDEAISLLFEARGKFSHPTLFLTELGRAYEVALRFPEAADWYCRAIEAGRDHEGREAIAEMVRTEPSAFDEVMRAIAARARTEEPGLPERYYALLQDLALDAGRFPEALEYAERLAALGAPDALARYSRIARAADLPDLSDEALRRLAELHPQGPLGLSARMERSNDRRIRLEPSDLAELSRLAERGASPERRAASYALFREALRDLRLAPALASLTAYFQATVAPADVALAALVRVCLDLARPDRARELLADPVHEAGRGDLAEGAVLLFEGSVEAALLKMEDAVLASPLAGGAAEAVDLCFLARLAKPEELSAFRGARIAAFAETSPGEAFAKLAALAEGSGEVALRAGIDAARILEARGDSEGALRMLLLAGDSGGTGADECAHDALDRLRRAGRTAEVALRARKFLIDHPTSPRFRSVKEVAKEHDRR